MNFLQLRLDSRKSGWKEYFSESSSCNLLRRSDRETESLYNRLVTLAAY